MSRNEELSYEMVLEEAEPYNEEHPTNPLEVYVQERESRRRTKGYSGRTKSSHRFIVVDHARKTIAHEGRWTTPGSHHNTYDEAKSRAFGFVAGHSYERQEHKRVEGDFEPGEKR